MEYLSENLLSPLSTWEVWAQRENIRPLRESTPEGERLISKRFGDCGKLFTKVAVEGGKTYELKATFTVADMPHPKMSTRFIFDSYTAEGKDVQCDYAPRYEEKDGVYTATGVFLALKDSAYAQVSAMIMSTEKGSLLIKEMSLRETTPIPERNVTMAAAYIDPYINRNKETYEERFAKVLAICDKAGQQKVDILCFPEVICTFMIPQPVPGCYTEPIPGPRTVALAEKAKKYGMYIIFNSGELADGLHYNTSVIIDRQGEILGKYRKCHITYNALNNGSTPSDEGYPVFDTDFGRIGTVTCFDQFFPESIRSLAVQGAEIVFVPTIGDGHTQLQAKAIENSIFICCAGVNHSNRSDQPMSRNISRTGEILAGTREDMGLAISTVNLNAPNSAFWFSVGAKYGNKNDITKLERRPETYTELTK